MAHREGRLAEHDIEQIGRVFDMRGLRPSQIVVTSRGVQETIDVATFGGEGRARFSAHPRSLMRDVHARFLDGVPLSALAFVGVVEQFARGLRLFARVFDLPAPSTPVALNVNPALTAEGAHSVPEDVARRIAALNRVDVELHAEAARRFEALCREHGVD